MSSEIKDNLALDQRENYSSTGKHKLCIVHIGMHKTGSTSIQRNLNKQLNKNFSYFALGTPNHSGPFCSLFSEMPESLDLHKRRGFTSSQITRYNAEADKMVKKHLLDNPQYDTFVISGESITILSKESLEKFKNYLLDFFETIKIVAYIRSPISYANSAFQQMVKGGFSDLSLFYNEEYPQYRNKFEKFDIVFGKENVFLHYFDKNHLMESDVTVDFIEKNNLKVNTKDFVRVNESLSLESISLLYVYNKLAPKPIQSREGLRAHHMLRDALLKIGSKKLQINKALLQSIINKSKHDLVWIEDRMNMKIFDEKSYSNDDSNIQGEEDLFEVAKLSINELENIIEKNNILIKNRAKSVQDIANLMHALYVKLLQEVEVNNIKYRVDSINKDFIKGWCIDEKRINTPVILELFINNEKIAEIVANKIRKGLVEKKLHPTGCAGFNFEIEDNILNENSRVVLKVKGSNFILNMKRAMRQF